MCSQVHVFSSWLLRGAFVFRSLERSLAFAATVIMAIVPLNPVRFRIGPERDGYIYEEHLGITVDDCPVYRCARGRDEDPRKLYLHWREQTGSWHAVSVAGPAPSAQDILGGAPAFRGEQGVDVRQPGTHRWYCYDNDRGAWWPSSPFDTTTQEPQVLYEIQKHFQRKFGLTSDQIPDCWVINSYNTADKFIDWHSDDDHLFGALDGPAEILSISLGADGVFCVKPNAESSA